MILELAVATGRPIAEVAELDPDDLATLASIADELGKAGRRG